jgi:hypothetical protein
MEIKGKTEESNNSSPVKGIYKNSPTPAKTKSENHGN